MCIRDRDGDNMRDSIFHMMNDYIENVVDMVVSPDQDYDEWNLTELNPVSYTHLDVYKRQ